MLSVHSNPQNVDHILVCTRSNTAFMMTMQGQVRPRIELRIDLAGLALLLLACAACLAIVIEHQSRIPYCRCSGQPRAERRAVEDLGCCLLQVVKTFQSGKKEGGDFVASWLSPRGAYLYCLGEDGNVFCFETIGKLESVLQVLDTIGTFALPSGSQRVFDSSVARQVQDFPKAAVSDSCVASMVPIMQGLLQRSVWCMKEECLRSLCIMQVAEKGPVGLTQQPTQEFGGNMVNGGCPEAMESMSLSCRPGCIQCLCQNA